MHVSTDKLRGKKKKSIVDFKMLKLVAVDWKSQEEVQIGVSLFMHRLKKTKLTYQRDSKKTQD